MHGFHGRILTVDLTARTADVRELTEADAALLGGKGLAARLLPALVPPGADPLGPENAVIFACGPLTGSRAWGAARYGVFTISPLTGGWLESYSGGRTPEAIDAAGYDAVVLTGAADGLTLVKITPEGCTLHDAGAMRGMSAYEAEEHALARADTDKGVKKGAAVIGPAGEARVPFAIIANDRWRCCGRGGTGAVLGSKNVKAVLFTGDRIRPLADPEGLATWAGAFRDDSRDNPGVKAYRARGTTQMVALMNTAGAFPARYWRQGTCEHWEAIGGDAMHQEHRVTPHACPKCFMACGRKTTITGGEHDGLRIGGPEYETIYAFGGLCMIEDMADIAHLNDVCDRVGLDTISAGNLCALAMEASEQGRLDHPIAYGDADACARLIEDMAAGRGLGAVLGKGIAAAARELGLEDLAVHVKGMEPPGYDPRVLKGMGLTYAVSDRGACHLRTTFYKPELAGMIPPDQLDGKAEMLVDFEDRLTIFDTLILCRFFRDLYTWEQLATVVELACGLGLDEDGLRAVAADIRDATRRINQARGVTARADRLPARLTAEALPSGHAISRADMDRLLADYYRLRGWDASGKAPERETQR